MSGAFRGPLVDRDICSETGMFFMMMNGYRALACVLIFATALVLGADLQAGTADAKSVVEKLHKTLLDVMKRADALGYSGRYDTLAPVVSASFDFDTIGQSSWTAIGRGSMRIKENCSSTPSSGSARVTELSVTGLTSNPTIFDHAIKNSTAYDAAIREKLSKGKSGEALFFELALEDITRAADLFRPVNDQTPPAS
jgi:transaldolase/fructose-6-phosphate aldolase-like protein